MSTELASRYQQLMRRIAALTPPGAEKVTLIAVSKTQPIEAIEALYHLGHRDFGENYVQELEEKADALVAAGYADIRWHFIGHLQTNKVKTLIPYLFALHTVDSEKLGLEVAKRWKADARGASGAALPCFIEVNIDREATKAGIAPEDAPALAATLSKEKSLNLLGLMAIPSAAQTQDEASEVFGRIRELETKCRPHTAGKLSMGMSGDYELAIPQGATHIRVGNALFGPRR